MKYSKPIHCPNCAKEDNKYNFKREWTSAGLYVNEVSCGSCNYTYRIYFGKRKDGSEIAYTIAK